MCEWLTNTVRARGTLISLLLLVLASCLPGGLLAHRAHAQCGAVDWSRAPDGPFRPNAGYAYDSLRQRVIAFGGTVPFVGQFGDETWSFDGSTWQQLFPTVKPPGRTERYNLAYDASRDRVVLFSGFRDNQGADTWEFDGQNWTLRAINGPQLGDGFAMDYDSARQRVVLFGGQPLDFMQPLSNQTWEYDGTAWIQRTPTQSPPALRYAGMAYDSARQRIVIFGGQKANFTTSNETWEYDGTTWTQRVGPGPAGVQSPAIGYDQLRQKVVLYIRPLFNSEVWELDGTGWTQRTLTSFNLCSPGLPDSRMLYSETLRGLIHVRAVSSPQNVGGTNYLGPITPPRVARQPISQTVEPGGQIRLSTSAGCTPGLTYLWRRNGVALSDFIVPGGASGVSGARGADIIIFGSTVNSTASGRYDCVITNACGSVTTRAAVVDVGCDPDLITYPIIPTPLQLAVTVPGNVNILTLQATLIGSMTLQIDPNCSNPLGTTARITNLDLRTQEDSLSAQGFGGTTTLTNPRIRMGDGFGSAGPAAPLDNSVTPNRFTQITNFVQFQGVVAYNVFGLNGTLNLATRPPQITSWTGDVSGTQGPDLTVPFQGEYVLEIGLGPLNPTLKASATLRGIFPRCFADLDDGSGQGNPDGAVDINDLLYYLELFEAGTLGADVDDGSGNGFPDGAVDINDLLYYLTRFETGC